MAQQPDDLELQVNNAGKRVFQMRREGRDLEYMVNQLDFEGYHPSVIQRILFAAKEQEVKENKVAEKSNPNYLVVRGGITLAVGALTALVPTFFGVGNAYYIIPIGSMTVGGYYLLKGILKKNITFPRNHSILQKIRSSFFCLFNRLFQSPISNFFIIA